MADRSLQTALRCLKPPLTSIDYMTMHYETKSESKYIMLQLLRCSHSISVILTFRIKCHHIPDSDCISFPRCMVLFFRSFSVLVARTIGF